MSDDESRTQAGQALVTLRARVDDHFDRALQRSPSAMQCRAGCDRCCHVRLSVFTVEAARISRVLSELSRRDPDLRQRIRERAKDPAHAQSCPMLIDSRCAIYEERPMICRSHGLPVSHQGETHWCELNFTAEAPPAQSVLRLEAVNQPLSVMARMWDGKGDRVELEELALALDG
jgi:uncharacterized protein